MYPPHVITKVALVWELSFTNITFYVEASARMLLLLVPLQTGDVIPAQTCWALFLSCKIILGLWSFMKYKHRAKTKQPTESIYYIGVHLFHYWFLDIVLVFDMHLKRVSVLVDLATVGAGNSLIGTCMYVLHMSTKVFCRNIFITSLAVYLTCNVYT